MNAIKNEIDDEIENLEQCVLYWTHGEMGYTQAPEELEEIENKISNLEKQKKLIELQNRENQGENGFVNGIKKFFGLR